jgi:hypothetical protein
MSLAVIIQQRILVLYVSLIIHSNPRRNTLGNVYTTFCRVSIGWAAQFSNIIYLRFYI